MSAINPLRLRAVARAVRSGGLIAYPTEAVYGLGCDPRNEPAVRRLLALKRRSAHKGLILIAADFAQLAPFLRPLTPAELGWLHASWPGPHTWLVPARSGTSHWLRGRHDTLAVRVTAHPLAAALCRACGHPLVSTSANLSGQPPIRDPDELQETLGKDVDYIVPLPPGTLDKPTPIFDARTGQQLR